MTPARLELVGGDDAGKVFSLAGERPFKVGSSAKSDLRLRAEGIAFNHAEIAWVDGGYQLTARRSVGGTFVQGDEVRARDTQALSDGDAIRFGSIEARFVVAPVAEAPSPAGAVVAAPAPETEPTVETVGPVRIETVEVGDDPLAAVAGLLTRRLGAQPGDRPLRSYALLDGASAHGVLRALARLGVSPLCLYPGELSPAQAEVAPYLVEAAPGSPTLAWLVDDGWGAHWGVLLLSAAEPPQLLEHLRSFLRVRGPDGASLLFRFYDPRVLRPFLRCLAPSEAATLFGGVVCDGPEGPVRVCPACEAQPEPDAATCPGCGLAFSGAPEAPFLIASFVTEGEGPRLSEYSPWPQAPGEEEQPPRRPPGALRLEVRGEQLHALAADFHRRAFVRWALDHVQRAFPDTCLAYSLDDLRALIRDGQARAARYGLVDDADVARFIDVMFLWHLDFETLDGNPWLPILEDPDLAPRDKADRSWATAKEVAAAFLADSAGTG